MTLYAIKSVEAVLCVRTSYLGARLRILLAS
jgi:hypothetical protein